MTAENDSTTDRPTRRQARGQQRIEAILDAAEELVGEAGFDLMGMNALADRAGISPGSLYQYFSSKDEVLDALVDRYGAVIDAFWDGQLADGAVESSLDELVGRLVDAMVAFKTARPAFWALFHGSAVPDRLHAAAAELDARLIARLDAIYAARAPHLDADRRRLIARIAVGTTKSLMALVIDQTGTDEQRATIAELKTALTAYLTSALDDSTS